MPGIGARLAVFYARHRNAVLAGGAAVGVVGVAAARKKGASKTSIPAADGTGYPVTYSNAGATPTYDTTGTDTSSAWGQFGDQLAATQDWQSTQFGALQDTLGQIQTDLADPSTTKTPKVNIKVPVKVVAPRPPRPHHQPKPHHAAPVKATNPRKPAPARRHAVKARPARKKPK